MKSFLSTKTGLILALIVSLHFILGITFGLSLPIFEAPDEANHFLFIRYLQIHHTLPVQTLDQNGPRSHHPPLYFILGAVLSAWVPNAGSADRVASQESGDFWFRYGDQSNDHKAKYIHTAQERWPFQGQALAVHVIRPLSTLFSTLAVIFTFLMVGELLPASPSVALLAAALLAFNPMVLFMSGTVQNSTSTLAASAACLYALSHWLRQGFTFRRWVGLGIIFSTGVLLQASGLALAAPVAVGLAYDAWRARQFTRLIVHTVAFSLPVIVLTGWWFVRNQILYGDWTANSIVGALWADQPIMPFEMVAHLLWTGMVGRFGFGLIIEYSDLIYHTAWLLAGLAALGLVPLALSGLRPLAARGWSQLNQVLNDETALWTIHVVTLLAVTLALIVYILWYIRGGHGRYLFTAYPSLALLLAAGALAWFRPPQQMLGLLIGSVLSLGLTLYGLFGLIIPTYAPPRSPTPTELRQMTPVDADIGQTARVLGYTLNTRLLRPGETLEVTVYWLPESQTDVPYTVFVHLLGSGVGPVAQQDTYPGLGNWPTVVWDVGRPFRDTYRLKLPPEAAPMDEAPLVLGLYDAQTMQRLPVTGANAGTLEEAWVILGKVQVKS